MEDFYFTGNVCRDSIETVSKLSTIIECKIDVFIVITAILQTIGRLREQRIVNIDVDGSYKRRRHCLIHHNLADLPIQLVYLLMYP